MQVAAIAALTGDQTCVAEQRAIYKARREALCGGLQRAGMDVIVPEATFYVLVGTPRGMTSLDYAGKILDETGVVVTPATGFGAAGEGFVRLTLCADKARLEEAAARLIKMS